MVRLSWKKDGNGEAADEDIMDKEFWDQNKILNSFEDIYDPNSKYY